MTTESVHGERGEGIGYVLMDSVSRPGLKHRVKADGSWCPCEAASYGKLCNHKRRRRADQRAQDGTYHGVSERRGNYGPYYVVVNHKGEQVTGPTFSKVEALGWAAEEDVAVVVPMGAA